jgi:putative flippase GtrA
LEHGQCALEALVAMTNPLANEAKDRTDGLSVLLALLTRSPLHLVVRFGLTGLTTTLVYFFLTNAFVLLLRMPPVVASVCAYLLSIGISYLLQSRFTFRVNGDSVDQVVRFVVASLAGLAASWCVMAITVAVLEWPYLSGALFVCVLIPAINFFVFRGWVFAMREGRNSNVADGEP